VTRALAPNQLQKLPNHSNVATRRIKLLPREVSPDDILPVGRPSIPLCKQALRIPPRSTGLLPINLQEGCFQTRNVLEHYDALLPGTSSLLVTPIDVGIDHDCVDIMLCMRLRLDRQVERACAGVASRIATLKRNATIPRQVRVTNYTCKLVFRVPLAHEENSKVSPAHDLQSRDSAVRPGKILRHSIFVAANAFNGVESPRMAGQAIFLHEHDL
jgi:hypothetical protein